MGYMSAEFWLTFNNRAEVLQLPVNPSEIGYSAGSINEKVTVQRLGEICIIQDPALKTFSLSSQFPKNWFPSCATRDIPDPQEAVSMIQRWKDSGMPCRLTVVSDEGMNLNFAVTIESFEPKEIAGDVGTIYYEMELQEYRFITIRTVETKVDGSATASTKGTRPSEKPKAKSHTVKAGENLTVIGQKTKTSWQKIAQANGLKAPYTIYPNQKLVIP